MRYAILGDIHANYEALEATLQACSDLDIDQYYCVGDIVGYGANPSLCLKTIRDLGCESVAGNHDRAVTGKLDTAYFNAFARFAVDWTRDQMSQEELDYLDSLDLVIEQKDLTITHAGLHNPEAFDYIQTSYDAFRSFQVMATQVCFIGHSHVPVTFLRGERIFISTEKEIRVDEHDQCLINVGSVGQPRDDNPKAAFGTFDTEAMLFKLHRLDYDIETASKKILDAGLPSILAERLKLGR